MRAPAAVAHEAHPAATRTLGSARHTLPWAALLSLLACGLRWSVARRITFCRTPDACFYLGMGQTLAAGKGFHARMLYDFQLPHLALPNTGIEYWRPGVSLLLLCLKPLGGVSLHSSIALTMVVGVVFCAAALHTARHTVETSALALLSFAFCLFSGPVWVSSVSPDSTLFYAAAVAWFLALFTVRRQGRLQDVLAMVCVSLAYLIRNDAVLLLVPLLVVLFARWRSAAERGPRERGFLLYALPWLAGFAVALAPMHLLYRAVLGTAFPSGTASVFFLNDLGDFVHYGEPATLHTLLAHGVAHLLAFRVTTLVTLLYRVAALIIGFPALVFLPGLLGRPLDPGSGGSAGQTPGLPEWQGAASFGLATLLLYTMVLPAIGAFSALRTLASLLPYFSVVLMVAIARLARTPRMAAWCSGAVVAAALVSGWMSSLRDVPEINGIGTSDRAEARALTALHADPQRAVVLTDDPVQFSVTTGFTAVALPTNGLDAVVAAAHDFHVTHVILKLDHLPAPEEMVQARLHALHTTVVDQEHTLILELPGASGDL